MQHDEPSGSPSFAKISSDLESEGSDARNDVSAAGAEAPAGEAIMEPLHKPAHLLYAAGSFPVQLATVGGESGMARDVSRRGVEQPEAQREPAQSREAGSSQPNSRAADAAAGAQQNSPQEVELVGVAASPDAILHQVPVAAVQPPACLPPTLSQPLARPPESLSSAQMQQMFSAQLLHQLMASMAGVTDLHPNLPQDIRVQSRMQDEPSTCRPPSAPPAESPAATEVEAEAPLSEIHHQALQAGVQEAQRHLQSILQQHWARNMHTRAQINVPRSAAISLAPPKQHVAAPALDQSLNAALAQKHSRPASAPAAQPSVTVTPSGNIARPQLGTDTQPLSALALLGAHASAEPFQHPVASGPSLDLSHSRSLPSPVARQLVQEAHTTVLSSLHHRMDTSLQSLQRHIHSVFGPTQVQTCSPATVEMPPSGISHASTSVEPLNPLPFVLPGRTVSLPTRQGLSRTIDWVHTHGIASEALPAGDSILYELHSLPSALYTAGLRIAEPVDDRDRAQSTAVQNLLLQGASASIAAAAAANVGLSLQQSGAVEDAMHAPMQPPGVMSSTGLVHPQATSTSADQDEGDVLPLLLNLQQRLSAVQQRLQQEQATAVGRMQRLAHSMLDSNEAEPHASQHLQNPQVALSRSPTSPQELLATSALVGDTPASGSEAAVEEHLTAHSAATMAVAAQIAAAQQALAAQSQILSPASITETLSLAQQQQYVIAGIQAAADALHSMHDDLFCGTRSQEQGTAAHPAHAPRGPEARAGAASAGPSGYAGNASEHANEAPANQDEEGTRDDVGSGSGAAAPGSMYPPVSLPTGASNNAPQDSGSTISVPGIGDQHGPGPDAAVTSFAPRVVADPSVPSTSAPVPQQVAQVATEPRNAAAAVAAMPQQPKRKGKFAANPSLHVDASEARQGKQARLAPGSPPDSRPPHQGGQSEPPDLDLPRTKSNVAGSEPAADEQQQPADEQQQQHQSK